MFSNRAGSNRSVGERVESEHSGPKIGTRSVAAQASPIAPCPSFARSEGSPSRPSIDAATSATRSLEVDPRFSSPTTPTGLVDPLAMMISTAGSVRFLAKAPLFQMPVIGSIMRGMGALPVYRSIDGANTSDNKDTFSAVFDALDEGELVALFPEGISHSLPNLQTLKTGAARMALGAEARAQNRSDHKLGVRIVPVGLNYGRKGRFRRSHDDSCRRAN